MSPERFLNEKGAFGFATEIKLSRDTLKIMLSEFAKINVNAEKEAQDMRVKDLVFALKLSERLRKDGVPYSKTNPFDQKKIDTELGK